MLAKPSRIARGNAGDFIAFAASALDQLARGKRWYFIAFAASVLGK
jgi:hypothetical protein